MHQLLQYFTLTETFHHSVHCLPIAGQQPTAVTQVDGQTTPPHTAQPAPLSSADIRRYERRLQEGYDLPDPRYLEWKDSTMRALPEEDLKSGCQAGECGHPRARKWIGCDACPRWYHCLCAGIRQKKADAANFICPECLSAS